MCSPYITRNNNSNRERHQQPRRQLNSRPTSTANSSVPYAHLQHCQQQVVSTRPARLLTMDPTTASDNGVSTPPPSQLPSADNAIATRPSNPNTSEAPMPAPMPAPAQPHTPNKRKPDLPHARFTTTERVYILLAVATARTLHNHWLEPGRPHLNFGADFCDKVRKILAEDLIIGGRVRASACSSSGKSPTDRTIRDTWANFINNGIPQAKIASGRRVDEEKRERIKQLLETGDLSTRKIARLAQTSSSLVSRVIQSLKKSPKGCAARATEYLD